MAPGCHASCSVPLRQEARHPSAIPDRGRSAYRMKIKPILFVVSLAVVIPLWLFGVDWYFDSSPEEPLLRAHGGPASLVEDVVISLYWLPYFIYGIWDSIFGSSSTIDRSSLFVFSTVQIIGIAAGIWFFSATRKATRWISRGYLITNGCFVILGFIGLHWFLRPAIENCCP
jgi:hypothetical protein